MDAEGVAGRLDRVSAEDDSIALPYFGHRASFARKKEKRKMAYKRERRMAHTNTTNPIPMDDKKAAGLPDSAWNGKRVRTCSGDRKKDWTILGWSDFTLLR